MKIRNGFVSNSSSSSFILISDKPLLTVEDVAECMSDVPCGPFDDGEPSEDAKLWNKDAAAQFVFESLKPDRSTFAYVLNSLYDESLPWRAEAEQRGASFVAAQSKLASVLASGKYLTTTASISDSGEWSDLESGDYFIDKIHISEH